MAKLPGRAFSFAAAARTGPYSGPTRAHHGRTESWPDGSRRGSPRWASTCPNRWRRWPITCPSCGPATCCSSRASCRSAAPGSKLALAAEAAALCAVNLLAQAKAATGDLDRVTRVVKLTGFVNCDATFTQHPQVINGASSLMGRVFGEAGRHSRAAVGSSSLPRGAIVEVEGVFEIE